MEFQDKNSPRTAQETQSTFISNKSVSVMEIMLAYFEYHTDVIHKYNIAEKFVLLLVYSFIKCARYSNYDAANMLVNTSD